MKNRETVKNVTGEGGKLWKCLLLGVGLCVSGLFETGLMGAGWLAVPAMAQTSFSVTYGFDAVVSGSNGRLDPTPPPMVDGLVFSAFTAVGDENLGILGDNPSAKAVFSYKGWPQRIDSLDPGNIHLNQYYEVRISPDAGYVLQVDTICFLAERTSTGPRCYAVRSNLDAYGQNLPASFGGTSAGDVWEDYTFDFVKGIKNSNNQVRLAQQSANTVIVRFYAWGSSNAGSGVFRLDNVNIRGKVFPDSLSQETEQKLSIFNTDWDTFPSLPVDRQHTQFTLSASQSSTTFFHDLVLPRACYDAALNIYQFDTTAIRIDSIRIEMADTLGNDCSHYFETSVISLENMEPYTDGMAMIRLIPLPMAALSETSYYRVSGKFCYTRTSDGESLSHLLYPAAIKINPLPACDLHYFVPADINGPLGIHLQNTSNNDAYDLQMLSDALWCPDTFRVDTLPANSLSVFEYWPAGDSSMTFEAYETAAVHENTLEYPAFSLLSSFLHPLIKDVSLYGSGRDAVTDFLVNDSADAGNLPDKIFSSQGERLPVLMADTMLADKILSWRDTLIHYLVQPEEAGWNYARTSLSVNRQEAAEILSVKRESDSLEIPLKNIWFTEDYQIHLMDTFSSATAQRYAVLFGDRGGLSSVVLPVYYREIADSICLGDIYTKNGFELPAQEAAGDYEYRDTLIAANGGDSIVILALNVCDVPQTPGSIYGDSVIVRAGNYIYSISPVPDATFYVWTVLPSDWKATGFGETMSLNIPYSGSGKISVRAANRCGQSQAASLDLLLSSLQETTANTFSIYPNPTTADFSIETNGITGKTTVAVSDMSGRLIYSASQFIEADNHVFTFSLDGYAQGMYIISIVNESAAISGSVLKE